MAGDSISYARIADRYERVRGGAARADELAAAIEPWLPAGVICDVGAGTGVVTERFLRPDRRVLALDLSVDMIRQALPRLPGRVTVADSSALPLATESVDAITFVWVLHHVGDLLATMAEARRVLRQGGRVVAVNGLTLPAADDMAPIYEAMNEALRPDRMRQSRAVAPVGVDAGFAVAHEGVAETTADVSPNELVASIEERLFSPLWDLPDDEWQRVVAPAIDALRSLPRPNEPRHRVFEHPMVVLDRA